jgi:predicted nucleotidyltransferase
MGFEKLKARWTNERLLRRREARLRREALLGKAIPVFERYGVARAVVFGSVARGSTHSESDIDLLVMPLEQRNYWDFRRALEEVLDYQIDLYTQADDSVLVKKIQERGDLIYDAQHRTT